MVWVQHDSVLSPLAFIIVLGALTSEFHYEVPWEGLICRSSCHHYRFTEGMCQEALGIEERNGGEWVQTIKLHLGRRFVTSKMHLSPLVA